jgi:hypothetical protein
MSLDEYNAKSTNIEVINLDIGTLTPKGSSPIFWPNFEVWAGHCGCNICPKNIKFSVNMWFSTNFKMH